MKEAFEKWEDISRDPQALSEYHSRRMAILDEASAIREAELREQRALLEGKREIVKQLILKGFDIETICEVSGLSRKEIDELSKHLQ